MTQAIMRCARHHNVETDLSCGRCETPICPRCLVHAEVGIRCRKCAPPPKFWERRDVWAGSGTFVIAALVIGAIVLWQFGGSSGPQGFDGEVPQGFNPSAFEPELIPLRQDSATPPSGSYSLAITRTGCSRVEIVGVTVCEGAVENISDAPLEDVTVVIEFLLENGDVGAIDRAPIQFNPLLPGQESSWSVQASYNPAFEEYRLSFETASGDLPARPPR